MALNKRYSVRYRRKRLGLTDYRARLRLVLSKKTRLVVRRSLNNFIVQLINYNPDGDNIIKSFNNKNLKEYGWKYRFGNLPSAYLLGLLIGSEAKKLKIKEAVLDIGLNESIKGSSFYAVLKGALDAGLNISHDKKILPNDDRIKGKHILDYYNKLSQDEKNKQFSKYIKNKINPLDIIKDFEEIKLKILNKYKNA